MCIIDYWPNIQQFPSSILVFDRRNVMLALTESGKNFMNFVKSMDTKKVRKPSILTLKGTFEDQIGYHQL